MAKIVQTAGRNALGEFALEFAHFMQDGPRDGQYSTWQKKCGVQMRASFITLNKTWFRIWKVYDKMISISL